MVQLHDAGYLRLILAPCIKEAFGPLFLGLKFATLNRKVAHPVDRYRCLTLLMSSYGAHFFCTGFHQTSPPDLKCLPSGTGFIREKAGTLNTSSTPEIPPPRIIGSPLGRFHTAVFAAPPRRARDMAACPWLHCEIFNHQAGNHDSLNYVGRADRGGCLVHQASTQPASSTAQAGATRKRCRADGALCPLRRALAAGPGLEPGTTVVLQRSPSPGRPGDT